MMDHTDKIEGIWHFCTCALADGNHWYRAGPLHIIFICTTCPGLHPVKGKAAVQSRYMGSSKRSCQGKDIHIRTRREMGMHNVEIMLFDIFHGFVHVVIGLEMCRPW